MKTLLLVPMLVWAPPSSPLRSLAAAEADFRG